MRCVAGVSELQDDAFDQNKAGIVEEDSPENVTAACHTSLSFEEASVAD